MKGETRTPEFLAKVNSNGRIPVLQDGETLHSRKQCACFYLADGSAGSRGPVRPRRLLRWMFWEQYSHEPNIATLRFWISSAEPTAQRCSSSPSARPEAALS